MMLIYFDCSILTHEQGAVGRDGAALDRACHHGADARHAEGLVDDKLDELLLLLRPTLALGQQVVEEAHEVQALACTIGMA